MEASETWRESALTSSAAGSDVGRLPTIGDEGLQTANGHFGIDHSPITADIRGRLSLSLEAPGAVFRPTASHTRQPAASRLKKAHAHLLPCTLSGPRIAALVKALVMG